MSYHDTAFEWIESAERLKAIADEINIALKIHNVLAVDLEYHNVQK